MKFLTQSLLCSIALAWLSFNAFGGELSTSAGETIAKPEGSMPSPAKATIGVMAHSDFVPDRVQPQKGKQIGLPDVLADRIIEHLSNSRRYTLVERTAVRRLVLEQRFGQDLQKTYLDQTLDKAIDAMENVDGGAVGISPDGSSPTGRARAGWGAVGTTGTLSDYNDLIKDLQDLGTALGADYLVFGNLEKLARSTKETAVPYSTTGRKVRNNVVDARLRLRVIDVKTGTIAGVTSIRSKLSKTLFEGKAGESDQYTFFDHLGRLAAAKVLDVTFPARIVNLEPMVISRGTNDGVRKGDIYLIEREGKELKDANDLVIARLKSEIGQVEVVTSQETVSVVKPVAGESFEEGDLAGLDTQASGDSAHVATIVAVPLTKPASVQAAPSKLPRVAIGLVKSGSTARTGNDAQEHMPIFTDTMISRLTQTKRFQLIDRQEVDQLLKEQLAQALAENRDMHSAMGTLKRADYLVYGSLASFSVEDKTIRLPNSSRSFKKKIGYVEGNMRIVDARSGEIMESRKISVEQAVDPSAKGARIVTAMADAYAEQVVLMLMNAIYPIKVAHVGSDRTVYINRGDDGGLYVGEFLDAFRPGRAIIDPDTGVQLGVEETVIAQVKVTGVEDARSKGQLIEGGMLSKGDLLKRALANKGKRASVALLEKESTPKRSGGVLSGGKGTKGSRGPQEKATLAVGLLRINSSARTTGLNKGHIKRMSDDLVVKLARTDRFTVMERQEVDQLLDEKAFEAVAAGSDIEHRLRELEGADYLIHGEIANFYIDVQRKRIPYVDQIEVTATGVTEGTFRIIDVHSGLVIAADKVRLKDKIKRADDTTQVMSDLMDNFTSESVSLIVRRLYPVKVLGMAADGIVYLNRGADVGLKRGTRFDVMRPRQELIDPDTGRSFGNAETKIALVEIVSVEASRSRAKLISGKEIRSGDILRKSQAIKPKAKPKLVRPAW